MPALPISIGNMLFLWVFGDNVEDAMGHLRFLPSSSCCGLAGSLAHALMNPASEQPLIGASGAISGVIASYLMLYPRVRIWGLAFTWIPAAHPALYALGAWILFQIVSALADPQGPCRLVGPSRRARRWRGADADLHPPRSHAVRRVARALGCTCCLSADHLAFEPVRMRKT
jgi:membrane associated rhomboid family serine protease